MKQAFGEVHMLSHLHGRGVREMATQIAEMQRRAAEIEARLRRAEAARNEALAERDAVRNEIAARAAARSAAPLGDRIARARAGCSHLARTRRANAIACWRRRAPVPGRRKRRTRACRPLCKQWSASNAGSGRHR